MTKRRFVPKGLPDNFVVDEERLKRFMRIEYMLCDEVVRLSKALKRRTANIEEIMEDIIKDAKERDDIDGMEEKIEEYWAHIRTGEPLQKKKKKKVELKNESNK